MPRISTYPIRRSLVRFGWLLPLEIQRHQMTQWKLNRDTTVRVAQDIE
jgi:hypothetical protein